MQREYGHNRESAHRGKFFVRLYRLINRAAVRFVPFRQDFLRPTASVLRSWGAIPVRGCDVETADKGVSCDDSMNHRVVASGFGGSLHGL